MHWLLTPYDQHSDSGFGAMGNAFASSAKTLIGAGHDAVSHRELPTCFLLRHACELYLKSVLVVVHRAAQGDSTGFPKVQVHGEATRIKAVHGLGDLYKQLTHNLSRDSDKLIGRLTNQWLPMPAELDAAIDAIDEMDASGVFFRYPTDVNSSKSVNKPMTAEEVQNWDQATQGFLKATLVYDDNDEVVAAYRYDSKLLVPELKILQQACDWLECIHVGLRHELAAGW
ncbi:hypothetical protein ACYX79_13400 [Stenotrophomonas rhizophila]